MLRSLALLSILFTARGMGSCPAVHDEGGYRRMSSTDEGGSSASEKKAVWSKQCTIDDFTFKAQEGFSLDANCREFGDAFIKTKGWQNTAGKTTKALGLTADGYKLTRIIPEGSWQQSYVKQDGVSKGQEVHTDVTIKSGSNGVWMVESHGLRPLYKKEGKEEYAYVGGNPGGEHFQPITNTPKKARRL